MKPSQNAKSSQGRCCYFNKDANFNQTRPIIYEKLRQAATVQAWKETSDRWGILERTKTVKSGILYENCEKKMGGEYSKTLK